MVHRFLEHNLVVIALKAAYLDGKANGEILEKDKLEEALVVFANIAVSVLPKEIRDWGNTVKDEYPSALINEPPIVFSPPKRSTFVGLIREFWLRGYRSSSNLTIEGPFETWLKALDKTDKELNLEAYEVGFEVIRKETSLLSHSEYKPSWALMVATDCSIGTYNVDMLNVGDIVDFYRVEALDPGRMVRLRAELRAPGDGWMEWRVKPHPEGGASLSQIAFFAPRGVLGFLYWHLLNPVHRLVFSGLIKRIAHQASRSQSIGSI